MKKLIQISLCFAGVALLAGPALAQAIAPEGGSVLSQDAPEAVAPRAPARGLFLSEDGSLSGSVTTVDRQTLELVAVANATVTFIQNKAVITQVKTDTNGVFRVTELSPMAVYSVFVTAEDMVAVFSTVVRPASDAPVAENAVAKKGKGLNNLAFVQTQLVQDGGQDMMSSAEGVPIQGVPMSDFQSFFGGPPNAPPPTAGGTAGGGGGGSGGGGGGALAGLAGLAAIAAVGSDNDAPQVSSPFETD